MGPVKDGTYSTFSGEVCHFQYEFKARVCASRNRVPKDVTPSYYFVYGIVFGFGNQRGKDFQQVSTVVNEECVHPFVVK